MIRISVLSFFRSLGAIYSNRVTVIRVVTSSVSGTINNGQVHPAVNRSRSLEDSLDGLIYLLPRLTLGSTTLCRDTVNMYTTNRDILEDFFLLRKHNTTFKNVGCYAAYVYLRNMFVKSYV